MARYIDADKLLRPEILHLYYHLPNGDIAIPIIDIKNAPTADVRENVRGEWGIIEEPDGYYHTECDICGQYLEEDVFMRGKKYNFCPNCGADMRGTE